MIFAIHSLVVGAADRKFGLESGDRTQRMFVVELGLAGKDVKAYSFQARGGPREIRFDQIFLQSNCLEDLGTLVALQCRNTHFGEGLQ